MSAVHSVNPHFGKNKIPTISRASRVVCAKRGIISRFHVEAEPPGGVPLDRMSEESVGVAAEGSSRWRRRSIARYTDVAVSRASACSCKKWQDALLRPTTVDGRAAPLHGSAFQRIMLFIIHPNLIFQNRFILHTKLSFH